MKSWQSSKIWKRWYSRVRLQTTLCRTSKGNSYEYARHPLKSQCHCRIKKDWEWGGIRICEEIFLGEIFTKLWIPQFGGYHLNTSQWSGPSSPPWKLDICFFSWWSAKGRNVHFLGETTLPSARVHSIRTQQTGISILYNIWVIRSWITVCVGHSGCNLRWATPNPDPFHSLYHTTSTVMMIRSHILLAQCIGYLLCTALNTLGLTLLFLV